MQNTRKFLVAGPQASHKSGLFFADKTVFLPGYLQKLEKNLVVASFYRQKPPQTDF